MADDNTVLNAKQALANGVLSRVEPPFMCLPEPETQKSSVATVVTALAF